MTEAEQQLQQYLESIRALRQTMVDPEQGFAYLGQEDFLLHHGVWYRARPWPASLPPGIRRMCYANALDNARQRGWKYIEGMAVPGGPVPFPVNHAWNLDADGTLIDTTWRNEGQAYLGVEFAPARARLAQRQNASVLDNWWDQDTLYRQKWTGENFGRGKS